MSLCAVVPVKALWEAKSRLGSALGPEERAELTLRMMEGVVSALREAGVENVCVVSPDCSVLEAAEGCGAAPLLQESRGLNPALEEARRWSLGQGASGLLVLPADLPLLRARDVREILELAEGSEVVISPDETRSGTNALLMQPPDAIPFAFGPGSFEAHLRLSRERGLSVALCERESLASDLDTTEDLARLAGALRP